MKYTNFFKYILVATTVFGIQSAMAFSQYMCDGLAPETNGETSPGTLVGEQVQYSFVYTDVVGSTPPEELETVGVLNPIFVSNTSTDGAFSNVIDWTMDFNDNNFKFSMPTLNAFGPMTEVNIYVSFPNLTGKTIESVNFNSATSSAHFGTVTATKVTDNQFLITLKDAFYITSAPADFYFDLSISQSGVSEEEIWNYYECIDQKLALISEKVAKLEEQKTEFAQDPKKVKLIAKIDERIDDLTTVYNQLLAKKNY